ARTAAASAALMFLNRDRSHRRRSTICFARRIVMKGLQPCLLKSKASNKIVACQSWGGTEKQPKPATSMPTHGVKSKEPILSRDEREIFFVRNSAQAAMYIWRRLAALWASDISDLNRSLSILGL